jgi:hypothetical protein
MNTCEDSHVSNGFLQSLYQEMGMLEAQIKRLEAQVKQLKAELVEKSLTPNGFIVEAISKQR